MIVKIVVDDHQKEVVLELSEIKLLLKNLIDLEYNKLDFEDKKPERERKINSDDCIELHQELNNSINLEMFLSRL